MRGGGGDERRHVHHEPVVVLGGLSHVVFKGVVVDGGHVPRHSGEGGRGGGRVAGRGGGGGGGMKDKEAGEEAGEERGHFFERRFQKVYFIIARAFRVDCVGVGGVRASGI